MRILFIRSLDARKEHRDAGDIRIDNLIGTLEKRGTITRFTTGFAHSIKLPRSLPGYKAIDYLISTILEMPQSLFILLKVLTTKRYRACTHVWMHPFSYTSIYMMPLFRLAGKRVIFDYNDDFFLLLEQYALPYRIMGFFLFRIPQTLAPYLATDIITTRHMAKRLGKRFERKVYVLPAGYSKEKFTDAGKQVAKRSGTHIGYFGLIGEDFDSAFAIKAFSEMKLKGTTLHLYGRMDPRFKRTGGRNVVYHGLIPHEQVAGEMRKMDVLLNTFPYSTLANSASPGKVFEYMAVGGAILSADILSVEGTLHEGRNALLYKPSDKESFKAQLRRLCVDAALRERLGRAAARDAKRYSWDVLTAGLMTHLKKR